MSRKLRMLCLFDYKCMSGFSTVSSNIVRSLKKHFDKKLHLDIVAGGYQGKNYETDDKRTRVFSAKQSDPDHDPYGRKFFLKLMQTHDYDIVFVIQDIGVFMPTVEVIEHIRKEHNKKFKIVYYYPIDGTPFKQWFDRFDAIDVPVPYTQYAKTETLKLRPDLEEKNLPVILHGVNTSQFHPLDDETKKGFREAYFGDNATKHIIGSVNRNQPRKDIPTTFFAFCEYRQKYNQDAFLYLHLDPHDPMGYNIPQIASQLNLKYGIDYRFPLEEEMNSAQDVGFLNCIYNSFDKFLTTTSGEGFGLTIVEAMACKVPVFAPDHTSIYELSGVQQSNPRRFWVCNQLRPFVQHMDNMIRMQPDYQSMATLMDIADKNPELTKQKVEAGYEFAQSLDWSIVNKQWIELFESLI
jgi:glycosyltransferase involved in cell wall biosynthesis